MIINTFLTIFDEKYSNIFVDNTYIIYEIYFELVDYILRKDVSVKWNKLLKKDSVLNLIYIYKKRKLEKNNQNLCNKIYQENKINKKIKPLLKWNWMWPSQDKATAMYNSSTHSLLHISY